MYYARSTDGGAKARASVVSRSAMLASGVMAPSYACFTRPDEQAQRAIGNWLWSHVLRNFSYQVVRLSLRRSEGMRRQIKPKESIVCSHIRNLLSYSPLGVAEQATHKRGREP